MVYHFSILRTYIYIHFLYVCIYIYIYIYTVFFLDSTHHLGHIHKTDDTYARVTLALSNLCQVMQIKTFLVSEVQELHIVEVQLK